MTRPGRTYLDSLSILTDAKGGAMSALDLRGSVEKLSTNMIWRDPNICEIERERQSCYQSLKKSGQTINLPPRKPFSFIKKKGTPLLCANNIQSKQKDHSKPFYLHPAPSFVQHIQHTDRGGPWTKNPHKSTLPMPPTPPSKNLA
jgi:hypothetical protein